jgi:hypothetical protein
MKKIMVTLLMLILSMTCFVFGEEIKVVKKIIVKSPKKGEEFYPSSRKWITWEAIGLKKGKVKIILRTAAPDSVFKVLENSLDIDRKWAALLLTGTPPGNYYIRIRHITTGIKGDSGIFRVIEPPTLKEPPTKIEPSRYIKVNSPKQGDKYYGDGYIKIDWVSQDLSETVKIYLANSSTEGPGWSYALKLAYPVNEPPYYFKCPKEGSHLFIQIYHEKTKTKGHSGVFSYSK